MNIKQEIKDLQQRIAVLESQLLDEPTYDWDNAPIITTIDGFEYRLGPHADKVMTWDDAVEWCQSVGGELPDRLVLLACWMNEDVKTAFQASGYWSSTESSIAYAWYQNFDNGVQLNPNKVTEVYVRAVKRFPLDK